MTDAITNLMREIQSKRDDVNRCLDEAINALSDQRENIQFPYPDLAGASPDTLTGATGLGYAH
jgi:hypothetical protein